MLLSTKRRWSRCVNQPPTIEAPPRRISHLGFPPFPLIVVSAYTPQGFISNFREDFGSVVRFVDWNFGIMEGALKFADARGTGDLMEFFPFGHSRHRFTAIKAPLSATDFLNAKPSGLPPDDNLK